MYFLIDINKVNAQVGAGEAVMNTIIGMGTVFVVLILISIIISLLKFIPKLFQDRNRQSAAEAAAGRPKAPTAKTAADRAVSAPKQEKAADDTQLVAVIMAAVAAQMEEETGVPVSADGLVIRSIKKRMFK